MYEIAIQAGFSAAHAVTIAGRPEAPHDHDWTVTVRLGGERLDDDGLLCDFHAAGHVLGEIVGSLHKRDLNRTPPFDRTNPSAERVARFIAERFDHQFIEIGLAPAGVHVMSVSVTEAPGCVATFRPGGTARR